VSSSRDIWTDAAVFRNADGALVVEVATTRGGTQRVRDLIDVARAAGIDLVWLHGSAVDAALGFRRSGGWGVDRHPRSWPAHGLDDSPGLLPDFRTPERHARFVRGAAGCLGVGPVTLVTWGDEKETLAAYVRLGFRPLESVSGWELNPREL
jgi:hypothetical protein